MARAAAIRDAEVRAAVAIPAIASHETLAVLEFLSCDPVEPTDQLDHLPLGSSQLEAG